jgi:hypothetical protein
MFVDWVKIEALTQKKAEAQPPVRQAAAPGAEKKRR